MRALSRATRIAAGPSTAPVTPRRLQPTPGAPAPPGYPVEAAPRDAAPKRRKGRSALTTIILLLLLAVALVGLYLAFTSGSGTEALPDVTQDTVQDTVDRMNELVDENSR